MLIALHRAGVEIKVLGRTDSPCARWLSEGVPFEPLVLLARRDRSGTESIRWHIDDFRPDILHLMGRRAVFNGLAAAKARTARIVLELRAVGNMGMLDPFVWTSLLSPRIDRIVCATEAVRKSFLRGGAGPLRLSPEKLVTIYEGHDLTWYRAEPLDLTAVGVPRGAFVVSCVASARPRRGVPVLIRATESMPAGLPIHFLLVGTGMTSPPITRVIRRSPYRDHFHVLGYRDDAPRILAASHVSVSPSLRREGLPRSVIESMAYRVPAVVSDAGGGPELVEHERSGLVVPAGDHEALGAALLRLYVDREFCAELGRNARRRIASTFTVERTAAETLELYERLLTSSDPSGA